MPMEKLRSDRLTREGNEPWYATELRNVRS
jgi:hypothetical protein